MLEETESSASPGTPVTKRIAGPGIWPKVKVYLAFSALAIFFAESVGGNYPSALLNPLVYIAYGFPFILLLDDLVRNGENRFYPWYFSGWLVGWVTEAYVAKVVFYGWPGDHEQIFGFAVGPILVVIFFYHAWITLLLTAYVARRYLGFPFQIQINRGRDRIALTTALVLSVISTHISISQGKPLPRTMIELALSFLILVVIINGLKKVGKIDDFRLSKDERTRILKWGVVIYVLFFLGGATEPHVKGQLAPFWPCIFSLFITFTIYWALRRSIRLKAGKLNEIPLSYDPEILKSSGWGKWIFTYFMISLIVLGASPMILGPVIPTLVGGMFITFILFGIICGLYCFTCLFRDAARIGTGGRPGELPKVFN